MTRHNLDADEVRRLYQHEGWTAARLAAHYGCADITILRRLKDLGIVRRPRGPQPGRGRAAPAWSAELAWAVGLMTADGNLSGDGRHLSLVSKDLDLLEAFRNCLGLTNRIGHSTGGFGSGVDRLQWSDRVMYDWLLSIGLMPAKSLRLGVLAVPDEYLADFVRGCIDGDGSIRTYIDRYNTFKSERYVYTRLYVILVSASPEFIHWLQASVQRIVGVHGALFRRTATQPHHAPMWNLKYAKREALILLRWMYYAPHVPCLNRKWEIARRFLYETK